MNGLDLESLKRLSITLGCNFMAERDQNPRSKLKCTAALPLFQTLLNWVSEYDHGEATKKLHTKRRAPDRLRQRIGWTAGHSCPRRTGYGNWSGSQGRW